MRDTIHFSHANGFPAKCYSKLFGCLGERFDIDYINTIGHNPRYPVTDNWPHLVEELIDHITRHHRKKVIGAGHSLGGYLSFMAAMQRPELFKAIVLLDAPLISYLKSRGLEMTKRIGIIDRITPAGSTKNRRREWDSEAQALAHFRHRGMFRRFDPGCLIDYVRHGMVEKGGKLTLVFDPGIEYRIYRAIPHHFADYTAPLAVPAGFIGGRDSDEVRRVGLSMMKRRYHFRFRRIEGTHLFPFEHPQATADAIGEMVDRVLEDPGF